MDLVRTLRGLWTLRRWLPLGLLLASVAALSTAYSIGVNPPSLEKKTFEIGAASTRVLVDSRRSAVVDLHQVGADFSPLASRAEVLANLMTSTPAKRIIGRRAHIGPSLIEAIAPSTTNQPQATQQPRAEERGTGLVAETRGYRVVFAASSELPILTIFTQAPSAVEAVRLANASASAVKVYVHDVTVRQKIPQARGIVVSQLGGANGGLVNPGIDRKLAFLAFFTALVAYALGVLVVSGLVNGWRAELRAESGGADVPLVAAVDPEQPLNGSATVEPELARPEAVSR